MRWWSESTKPNRCSGYRKRPCIGGCATDSSPANRSSPADRGASASIGQFLEPPLDQVEPRRAGRREVQVPSGPFGMVKPAGDLGAQMGGEVVQDDVDLEPGCDVEVD